MSFIKYKALPIFVVDELRNIFRLSEELGKKEICNKLLGKDSFDEAEDLELVILQDIIYETVKTLGSKGILWDDIAVLTNLTMDICSKLDSCSVPDLILLLNRLLSTVRVSDLAVKIFIEYITETVVQHLHLYKFVLFTPQDELRGSVSLKLETPQTPLPFAAGIQENVWKYQQKMTEIESWEKNLLCDHEEKRKDLIQEEDRLQLTSREHVDEQEVTTENIKNLVSGSTAGHFNLTKQFLETDLSVNQEHLIIDLEKAILPRPAVLGPLQRRQVVTQVEKKTSAKKGKGSQQKSVSKMSRASNSKK